MFFKCPQTRSYSPSPVSTAVPVRTVTSTIGRSNSNPGTVINYSSMVDGSQQVKDTFFYFYLFPQRFHFFFCFLFCTTVNISVMFNDFFLTVV